MKDSKNINRTFRQKFKKVFHEIDYLEIKIYKKEGWIFTNHIYSKEELLNSEHHQKIYSITEKIGDDAENWYARGNLSESEKELYYDYREEVKDRLHEVNLKISSREPTWWESVKGSLDDFVEWVMENMPNLERLLLTLGSTIAKLPGPVGKLGSMMVVNLNTVIKKISINKMKRLGYKNKIVDSF